MTPRPLLTASPGENRGDVAERDVQIWTYDGQSGEILTIEVHADYPANGAEPGNQNPTAAGLLDTLVIVTAPDGRDLNVYNSGGSMLYTYPQSDDIEPGVLTDSRIDGMVPPVDGTYQIIVSGSGYQTGGAYTLIIESHIPPPATPTPAE